MMGSQGWYIDSQQNKAAADNAPIDAIYENRSRSGEKSGSWSRLCEVTNPDTRYYFMMHHPDLEPEAWNHEMNAPTNAPTTGEPNG
jgi:hypothetical protein